MKLNNLGPKFDSIPVSVMKLYRVIWRTSNCCKLINHGNYNMKLKSVTNEFLQ